MWSRRGAEAAPAAACPSNIAASPASPCSSTLWRAWSGPDIGEIRVVIGAGQEALYREAIGARALPSPVAGGRERQDSVRNGLEAIAAEGGADAVFIHDAARPFLPAAVVARLREALAEAEGAVPVLPVVDTLARAEAALGDPVGREGLVRVQTPQAFRFEAILAAHRQWSGPPATDDAQVARAAGLSVAAVAGDEALAKLTHEADFERAEARLAAGLTSRTGLGFDVHAFAAGEELWLGGIRIPHERGLKGHSDADVLLHARHRRPARSDRGRRHRRPFPAERSAMARRRLVALRRACPSPDRGARAAGSTMSTSP